MTLENFREAWAGAPWLDYFLNSFLLVTSVLAGQFVLVTLAGFAFAQLSFRAKDTLFVLVLLQLFSLPEVLIVESSRVATTLGLVDTILGIGAPYMASAFGIFLMRQAFKSVPKELDEAARVEGCSLMGVLWCVYVPAARRQYATQRSQVGRHGGVTNPRSKPTPPVRSVRRLCEKSLD